MTSELKLLFSAIAVALTLVAFIPYIRSIVTGKTKPHVFSWIIWGITTMIVFFAQLQAEGGIGAWPIGISGAITILIACLAIVKRADVTITKLDGVFFSSAILSLPVWYFTTDPFWAVLILTVVDLLGFGPTIRKVYDDPFSENRLFFLLFLLRNMFAIFALESYSVTTVLFPLSILLACAVLIVMITIRRKQV